jgi:hypothetical protein
MFRYPRVSSGLVAAWLPQCSSAHGVVPFAVLVLAPGGSNVSVGRAHLPFPESATSIIFIEGRVDLRT